METEPDSVLELQEDKFYHLHFKNGLDKESVANLVRSIKQNNIHCIVTMGECTSQNIVDTIKDLPLEYKRIIFNNLNKEINKPISEVMREIKWDDRIIPDGNQINPLGHEISK